MKTVFTTSMCTHVWAQQVQENGRGPNRSLYFEGPTLYSYGYHYVLGHFFLSPSGRRYVVINSERYSNTTAKHVSKARSAVHGHDVNVLVAPVDRQLAWDLTAGNYEAAWDAIRRGRDHRIVTYRHGMDSKQSDAIIATVQFAESWGLALEREDIRPAEDSEAGKRYAEAVAYRRKMEERRAKSEASRNDMSPEAVAKRKRDYERRNAALLRKHNDWFAEQVEELNHWRRYENVSKRDRVQLDYKTRRKLEDMHEKLGHAPLPTALRRKDEYSEVETSRGAWVPWRDAVRLYQFATMVKEGRLSSAPDRMRCGLFTLNKVHPNGDVQVGCHFLTYHEMHHLAHKFGVAVIEPQTQQMEV
ncbi:hypothetical protein [Aestuariivirga sp.]|uniref:hypothetical protein n=1 Tax=Aestuariivirga sp. TaxID=2650926 RepID=UPI0039E2EC86